MTCFRDEILTHYQRCGDRHIVPFVGDAFINPAPSDFRIVVVGFNCYISVNDWPNPIERVQPWFEGWWRGAGRGAHADTHRFYNDAFRELSVLSDFVAKAPGWAGLTCNLVPDGKHSLYATNALKIYTSEDWKKSSAIPLDVIAQFAAVWRDELDTMARFDVLPHLIVVLGRALWESHWHAFHPKFATAQSFAVRSYVPAGDPGSTVFNHANRIVLDYDGHEHALILACLHHPSAWAPRGQRRNAKWLIAQEGFQKLLDVPPSASGAG